MPNRLLNLVSNAVAGVLSAYFFVLFMLIIYSNSSSRIAFSIGMTKGVSPYTVIVLMLLILATWHYTKTQQKGMLVIATAGILSHLAIISGLFI